MSKDLRFNILVRENFNRALSVGRSALNGFTSFVGGISRRLRRMLNLRNILVGGGLIASLTRLAKAYGEQEAVDRRLAASFGATGAAADAVIKKWGDFATSIQRVTTLGDEEIMMLIALAKNMGVADEQMEQATKGAIGLSKAFGIDLNTAMKGVAMALQGEFTMLSRYIPALRTANTESEKMAILQKAMASGFNIAKAELGTINGMWAAFKGVIGDAMQAAGKGLFGGGGLIDGIRKLKERVIELTESGAIEEWAKRGAEAARVLGDILGDIFSGDQQERAEALGDIGRVIRAIFQDAGTVFLNVVGPGLSRIFSQLPGVKQVGGFGARVGAEMEVQRQMREEGKLGRFGIRSDAREEFDRRVQEAMDGAGPAIQFQSSGEVGALAAALEEMRSRRNPEPVFETSPEPAATPEVVVKESAVAEEAAEKAVAAGQLSLGEVFSRINDGTAERLQRQANEYLHMIARAMSTETQA